MIHELKTWPDQFQAVVDGHKHFEVRTADRDFGEHDVLWLREFDPATQEYTGRSIKRCVLCITWGGQFGLPDNLCVIGLDPDDLDPHRAGNDDIGVLLDEYPVTPEEVDALEAGLADALHNLLRVSREVERWAIANCGTKDEFVRCHTPPHGEIPEPIVRWRRALAECDALWPEEVTP